MVEVMIVIVIVGIMAGVAAPPFFRYLTSNRLQTGTDRLVADLQYARSLAISNAQILRFTSTAAGYQVIDPLNGTVIRRDEFRARPGAGGQSERRFLPLGDG